MSFGGYKRKPQKFLIEVLRFLVEEPPKVLDLGNLVSIPKLGYVLKPPIRKIQSFSRQGSRQKPRTCFQNFSGCKVKRSDVVGVLYLKINPGFSLSFRLDVLKTRG